MVLVCMLASAYLGYLVIGSFSTGMSPAWLVPSTFFVAMALLWDERTRLGGRLLAAVTAAQLLLFLLGGSLAGRPLAELLMAGPTNALTAWLTAVVYRAGFRGRPVSWIPRDAPEAVWMMVAVGVSVPVGVLLGAFPGAPWAHATCRFSSGAIFGTSR